MKRIDLFVVIVLFLIVCNPCYAKVYLKSIVCWGCNCDYSYDLEENKSFGYIGIFDNFSEADKAALNWTADCEYISTEVSYDY